MLKIFLTIAFLLSSNAFAQTVEKVKGAKALLDLAGTHYQVGTEVVSVTVDGRKIGLLKIVQVKGDKAIADILKGTVVAGMGIAAKPKPKKRFADEPTMEEVSEKKIVPSKNAYGVIFAYSLDSMTMTTTATYTFSGNTFKLKGFYDYAWNDPFALRFSAGLDGFNVKGSAGNLAIQYLAGDGALMWNFYKNKANRAYADGGFSYQIPSGSSNNLGIAATNNSVFFVGGGLNMSIQERTFMTFFLHYNIIAPSTGITLNSIDFGCGIGWN